MNDDYISRQTLIDRINGTGYADQIKDNLLFIARMIPAADVKPVVHAHWFLLDEDIACSECGTDYHTGCDTSSEAKRFIDSGHAPIYCPGCGARMDGEV